MRNFIGIVAFTAAMTFIVHITVQPLEARAVDAFQKVAAAL